jgi:hypothetical protein
MRHGLPEHHLDIRRGRVTVGRNYGVRTRGARAPQASNTAPHPTIPAGQDICATTTNSTTELRQNTSNSAPFHSGQVTVLLHEYRQHSPSHNLECNAMQRGPHSQGGVVFKYATKGRRLRGKRLISSTMCYVGFGTLGALDGYQKKSQERDK